MERDGRMENGRYKNNSFGKSGLAKFLGGGGKLGVAYSPTFNHTIALSAGAGTQAPLARNAFVAPRAQNNFVDHLTNEDIYDADLSYTFRLGPVVGKLSGYYARFGRQVEQSAFYNDQQSTFTYLTMTGVRKEHVRRGGGLRRASHQQSLVPSPGLRRPMRNTPTIPTRKLATRE